jgi:hypothetical protein
VHDGSRAAKAAPRPRRQVVQVAIDHRHHHQRQQRRGDDAADHRLAHRRALLGAFGQREGQRHHAEDHGQRGHQDRPQPHLRPRAAAQAVRSMPSSRERIAKSTSRIAFFVTRPISMTMPMIENMFSVEPNQQRQHHADQRQRQRAHQRQRLQEAAELAGQDHVDEDHASASACTA